MRGLAEIEQQTLAGAPPPRVVVFVDADHSDHVDLLPQLVAPIFEDRADMVLGSRILGEREPGAMPPAAYFGNHLAYFLMRMLFRREVHRSRPVPSHRLRQAPRVRDVRRLRLSMGAALALALGVGAKLFPVDLVPLLLWTFAKRGSVKTSLLAAVVFVTVSFTVLWPMLPTLETSDASTTSSLELNNAHVTQSDDDQPPLPPTEVSTSPRDPSESLRAFLGRWEMNDFLFLIVIENLRPSTGLPPEQIAWFTVTPESWRQGLVANVVSATGVPSERVPFLLTRLLLGSVFVTLSAGLIGWATARGSGRPLSNAALPRETNEISALASRVLEVAFLTLVWFWLLLPTQNPWYLTWALPLIPFARCRVWFALSGLAFVYYLRFWMTARLTEPLWGTPYSGSQFFDVIITWFEFAPWLVWLTWSSCGCMEHSLPTSPTRRPNDDFVSVGISAQSNVPH